MSISVTSRDASLPSGGGPIDESNSPASFKAAATSSPSSPLSVTGNSIDTGRYVITGSTFYDRPTGGGSANDGMVKIFDKTNQSFVDVYGDPHVYTSSGDRANFQSDGLTINLADGTQVQFKPTAEVNGVSHLDSIAVTKTGQTVIQSGYFATQGGVSTGPVTQGAPTQAQGFDDTRDTVLSVGHDGSLGTLVNTMGMQLGSMNYEQSLDGMGGGVSAFANMSGVNAVESYSSALSANAGAGGGPNAANDPSQAGALTPLRANATDEGAGSQNLVSLLEQLISLLQPKVAATPQITPNNAKTSVESTPADAHASAGGAPTGSGELVALLKQLIALLQGQASGSTATPQDQALIKQLLPLLQAKVDGMGGAQSGNETTLLQQLIATLQPVEGSNGPMPATYNPATGVSQQEVNAMLEHSNGTGPEVNFAAYDKAAATYATTSAAPTNVPQSYNPAMGISGNEIMAMLANANGTGPEVNFADYDKAAANYEQSSASSATNGQATV